MPRVTATSDILATATCDFWVLAISWSPSLCLHSNPSSSPVYYPRVSIVMFTEFSMPTP